MSKSEINFPLWDCLKPGGLSLWLNRQALLPLTALPVGVTFVTLALIRTYAPADVSHFTQALFQIPSDLAIGLFCSLILVIIMNAPKKNTKDPVTFNLNLADKKRVMFAGAVAHVVFSYLYIGAFAGTDLIAAPLREASAAKQEVRLDLTLLVIGMLVFGVYAIRFALLPILIVAGLDIKDFYRRFKGFGLSFPVLFIKLATTFTLGILILLPLGAMTPPDGETLTLAQGIVVDFAAAFAAVLSHAWGYAALAIGMRYMIDGDA